MLHTLSNKQSKAILGWFLIALFFCYQYLLRVIPGVISDELRHAFYMTAEDFSSLGSYSLYAYSFLQIPIGFIVDRIGIKRSVLFSLFLCILGTFWLTQTHSLFAAQMSRVLVGAGSASAFMGAIKWVADHFEPGRRGTLMGATLVMGTFGALGAGHPLVMSVEAFGWKQSILLTCILGVFLVIFIALFLKDSQKKSSIHFDMRQLKKDLKTIACNKTIVIYALLAIGVYTPLAVLADLWGVSFLMQKFHITRADAASTTMLMYLGLAIGSLTLPAFAERYRLFTRVIQICSLGLLALFSGMLMAHTLSMLALKGIFLLIGCLCGAEMICFSGALIGSEKRTSGLTIGFVNTMNMLGGAVLQQLIGTALDWQWNGAVDPAGVRLYTMEHYVWALMILPIVLVACVLLSMTLKKKDFDGYVKGAH